MDQLALDFASHQTPQACLVDLTPPTFAGITGLVPQVNGSLLASWGAGSDATAPISYEVYLQAGTAVGLFNVANIAFCGRGLSAKLFQDALSAYLVKGTTYFVGVRAVDAVGNRDSNTVSLSAVSAGVLTDDLAAIAAALAATEVLLAADEAAIASTASDLAATEALIAADEAALAATAADLASTATDLDATAAELDAIADTLAQSANTEFVAELVEDELQAVVESDDTLTAQLECEEG